MLLAPSTAVTSVTTRAPRTTSPYDLDLIVLGAGSGDVRASRVAASLGARVAVVEGRFLGGTCVNVGCAPKKLMVYGAHVRDELDDARGFGWTIGDISHDWTVLRTRRDAAIARLNFVHEKLLRDRGVDILLGYGTLRDAHTVSVSAPDGTETTRTAANVLIATGGRPVRPGGRRRRVLDHPSALDHLSSRPRARRGTPSASASSTRSSPCWGESTPRCARSSSRASTRRRRRPTRCAAASRSCA